MELSAKSTVREALLLPPVEAELLYKFLNFHIGALKLIDNFQEFALKFLSLSPSLFVTKKEIV